MTEEHRAIWNAGAEAMREQLFQLWARHAEAAQQRGNTVATREMDAFAEAVLRLKLPEPEKGA